MSEAARLECGEPSRTWVLGLRQTAGRGRRGRPWVDPVGNFAATLSVCPAPSPEMAALRSFVAALALAEALDAITGQGDRIRLKWPNDLLLDGGKVAGILLEYDGASQRLLVGIGVNLVRIPADGTTEAGQFPPVSVLDATGIHIEPEMLLDHLAPAFAGWESLLDTSGFGAIREAFLARAARLGEPVTARTARDSVTGTFETLDDSGAIILATPRGRIAVSAGDIFF